MQEEREPKTIARWINSKDFKAIKEGLKNFDLIKDKDDIKEYDLVEFREWDGKQLTENKILLQVKCVLRDCPKRGLMDGYCIIGF